MTTEKPMGRPPKNPIIEVEYLGERYLATKRGVSATGNGARVYLPLEWAGKNVLCILLD